MFVAAYDLLNIFLKAAVGKFPVWTHKLELAVP